MNADPGGSGSTTLVKTTQLRTEHKFVPHALNVTLPEPEKERGRENPLVRQGRHPAHPLTSFFSDFTSDGPEPGQIYALITDGLFIRTSYNQH
jgi:hypothetical protein